MSISRTRSVASLAACEGALLVVDAAQGIEAQTMANVYLALEQDLAIVAVINKIDLPNADPVRVTAEVSKFIGLLDEEIVPASAKEGRGITEILEAVIRSDAGARRKCRWSSASIDFRFPLRPLQGRNRLCQGGRRQNWNRRADSPDQHWHHEPMCSNWAILGRRCRPPNF